MKNENVFLKTVIGVLLLFCMGMVIRHNSLQDNYDSLNFRVKEDQRIKCSSLGGITVDDYCIDKKVFIKEVE